MESRKFNKIRNQYKRETGNEAQFIEIEDQFVFNWKAYPLNNGKFFSEDYVLYLEGLIDGVNEGVNPVPKNN